MDANALATWQLLKWPHVKPVLVVPRCRTVMTLCAVEALPLSVWYPVDLLGDTRFVDSRMHADAKFVSSNSNSFAISVASHRLHSSSSVLGR